MKFGRTFKQLPSLIDDLRGLLGNETPLASVVGEIRSEAAFYDYQSKYVDDTSEAIIEPS